MHELDDCAVTIDALVRLLALGDPGSLSSKHYTKRLLEESDKMLKLTRALRSEAPCWNAQEDQTLIVVPPPASGTSAINIPVAGSARTSSHARPVAGGLIARD